MATIQPDLPTDPAVEAPRLEAPSRRGNAVVRGSFWTIAGYGAGQVLRLAGNVIVSRLVVPEAFGLMALVGVSLQALVMFSDLGIEPSIIQHRRGDEGAFRNTAWSLQVLRGLILGGVAALLAWPLAWFYAAPELRSLLPVAGLTAVLAGFNSIALYSVRRHLLLGRLTLLELASQALGLGAMIGFAWFEPSAWALVVGSLVTTAATMIGSHYLLPEQVCRPAWDRAALHDLLHFGKWILVSTIVTFCAMQVDRLMLGKLISMHDLGVYSVAAAIATLPNIFLGMLSGSVMFPLIARHARISTASMSGPFLHARDALLSIGMTLVLGVVLEASTFFRLVYDARYQEAGWIAPALALAVWVMLLSTTVERALQALGEPRSLATFNLLKLLVTVPACYIGYRSGELPGFLLGIGLGALVGHLWLSRRLASFQLSIVGQDLRYSAVLTALALAGVYGGRQLEARLPWGNEALAFPLLIGAGIWCVTRVRRLRDVTDD